VSACRFLFHAVFAKPTRIGLFDVFHNFAASVADNQIAFIGNCGLVVTALKLAEAIKTDEFMHYPLFKRRPLALPDGLLTYLTSVHIITSHYIRRWGLCGIGGI